MQLNVTKYLTLLALLGSAAGTLQADSFTRTYTGSLSNRAAVIQETFSLSSFSDLLVTTTSYGSGTNLDGSTASAGVFQPSVTLYTAGGIYVASQQASSPVVKADSTTGLALDAYLSSLNLSAGSYILTLTDWQVQQPPTVTNLSDGFINYGGTTLIDVGGNTRNATYAINVLVTPTAAAVPEPATVGLILIALSGITCLHVNIPSLIPRLLSKAKFPLSEGAGPVTYSVREQNLNLFRITEGVIWQRRT